MKSTYLEKQRLYKHSTPINGSFINEAIIAKFKAKEDGYNNSTVINVTYTTVAVNGESGAELHYTAYIDYLT